MVITSNKYNSGLVLELKGGVDEKGNDKVKNKTI